MKALRRAFGGGARDRPASESDAKPKLSKAPAQFPSHPHAHPPLDLPPVPPPKPLTPPSAATASLAPPPPRRYASEPTTGASTVRQPVASATDFDGRGLGVDPFARRGSAQASDEGGSLEGKKSLAGSGGSSSGGGSGGGGHPKQVSFRSPPPTPGPSVQPLPGIAEAPPQMTKRGASMDSGVGVPAAAAASTRSVSPLSTTSTRYQSMSPLPAGPWSGMVEEDLVENLGSRERTRQEVLWEIVASEERYVSDLQKLNLTFISTLLHPHSHSPLSSPVLPSATADDFADHLYHPHYRSATPHLRSVTPATSNYASDAEGAPEHLPIASMFLNRPSSADSSSVRNAPGSIGLGMPPPADEDYERDTISRASHDGAVHPSLARLRDPHGASTASFPPPHHHAHDSPPPAHAAFPGCSGTASKPRNPFPRKLHKKKLPEVPPETTFHLPPDLRAVLEVLGNEVLPGHEQLSEGLRHRHDAQYPLVRSLADVFLSHAEILSHYSVYVLHLERTLQQIDEALSIAATPQKPKRPELADMYRLGRVLHRLERKAADAGECGLAIALSKPFQRLLKYPLLFRNLLYNSDPSMFEYEATLQMVEEVETIVRSIEDRKIEVEERDRTRDALARIEGIERDRTLMAPKATRLLVEERPLVPPTPVPAAPTPRAAKHGSLPPPARGTNSNLAVVKQKTSFRRLSDLLPHSAPLGAPPIGGKKDIWLVSFNDVVLRCQRTGVTSLAMSSGSPGKMSAAKKDTSKMAEPAKKGDKGKSRNLYRFIKIENWVIAERADASMVSMDDIHRNRTVSGGDVHPSRVSSPLSSPPVTPMTEEHPPSGSESDELESRVSRMSFSYRNGDDVQPVIRAGRVKVGTNGKSATAPAASAVSAVSAARRPAGAGPPPTGTGLKARRPSNEIASVSKNSAKFGTRLRSPTPVEGPRSASRATTGRPVRAAASAADKQRPAWGGGPGAPRSASAVGHHRQAPNAAASTTSVRQTAGASGHAKATSSPVPGASRSAHALAKSPSEDSGIALARVADAYLNGDGGR